MDKFEKPQAKYISYHLSQIIYPTVNLVCFVIVPFFCLLFFFILLFFLCFFFWTRNADFNICFTWCINMQNFEQFGDMTVTMYILYFDVLLRLSIVFLNKIVAFPTQSQSKISIISIYLLPNYEFFILISSTIILLYWPHGTFELMTTCLIYFGCNFKLDNWKKRNHSLRKNQ